MNNIPEGTPPKRARPHYKALFTEAVIYLEAFEKLTGISRKDVQAHADPSDDSKYTYKTFEEYEEEVGCASELEDENEELKEENEKLQEIINKKSWEGLVSKANKLAKTETHKNFREAKKENEKLKAEIEELKADVERLEQDIAAYENTETDDIQEIEKLREEMLQTKFDAWREVQQETNPQYTIDEEIGFLLGESDDTKLIKKIFDELYAGQYVYVIETETYREWEDDDDE